MSSIEIFQEEKTKSKKRKEEEEEKEKEEKKEEEKEEEEIIQECAICFSSLNSSGEHKITSLKCGHVFGKCCIKLWLNKKNPNGNRNKCPICGKNASLKDLYPVYSKYLIPVSKDELDKEIENKNKAKRQKKDIQDEYNSYIKQYNDVIHEVNNSKTLIKNYQNQLSKLKWNSMQQNYLLKKFNLLSTWKISSNPNACRVFTYDENNNIIFVTKTINHNEHGILGINIENNSILDYSILHKKLIRDCEYNLKENILLTASMDKSMKIYSPNNKNIVQSIELDSACWSCCWSKQNENHFYSGLANNKIYIYDIRKSDKSLSCISNSSEMGIGKPVHSLMSISNDSINGILGASLDKVFFCKENKVNLENSINENDYSISKWDINHGLITSLSYDIRSNQCVVSSRKGPLYSDKIATMYTVGYLSKSSEEDSNDNIVFKKRHEIIARNEQKLMTKATIYTQRIQNLSDKCFVCVSDEHAKSICVWQIDWNEENSMGVHSLNQEILTNENSPILDLNICTIKKTETDYLCALNENKLFIHQTN